MTSERASLVQTKKSTENKVIPRSQLALQVEASTQTLPDESDLIIHELNQKLNSLRQQLVNYESQRQQTNGPSPRQLRAQLAKQEAQLQDLQAEKATVNYHARSLPQTFSALRKPASQLEEQVGQLLEKIPDPEVRKALEHCRQMAKQMLDDTDTQQQELEEIHQDYQPERRAINLLKFFRGVARQHTQQSRHPLRLFASTRLPDEMRLDPAGFRRALLAMLQEVRRQANTEPLQLLLQTSNPRQRRDARIQITVKIDSGSNLSKAKNWGDYLAQRMSEADGSPELLIGRKIIYAHGGRISLRREEDQVVGLEVSLPMETMTHNGVPQIALSTDTKTPTSGDS